MEAKQSEIDVGGHTESSQNRPHVKIDLRMISLATFLVGLTSTIIICVFSDVKPYSVRKVALGGALDILALAKYVSFGVAITTAVARVQLGLGRYVEILPRNSAGVARALIFAVLLTFLDGGLCHYANEKMWESERMFHMGSASASITNIVGTSVSSAVASASASG
ncbi:hypothetical protein JCM33374_g4713 [Metschnikowia sp. JCM 33374]|nr:hypothetical protein JCM33374_g4713 [Metschnikowia sp. JCM 33374]